jgi:hypothetical protein
MGWLDSIENAVGDAASWVGDHAADIGQGALDVAGMIPGLNVITEGAQTIYHAGMGVYDEATGDTKGAEHEALETAIHGGATALNLLTGEGGEGLVAGEALLEAGAEHVGEAGAEHVLESGAEQAVESTTENVAEQGTEQALETSSENVAEQSTEQAAETSGENAAEQSTEQAAKGEESTAEESDRLFSDEDIDGALENNEMRSDNMYQVAHENGSLGGSGPKEGTGDIWYHDNIKVKGGGPGGAEGNNLELRTHSPNPNAPDGSYSQTNYTTQVNTSSKPPLYRLPDGTFKAIGDMTDAERAAAHYPAG